MKLTTKFITLFILTALAPLVLLGYLSYSSAKQALRRQAIEDLLLVAEAKEGQLYSFLDAMKWGAIDLSSDGFIRDSAKTLQELDTDGIRYLRTQRALNAHLRRNKKPPDKSLQLIYVISLHGEVIASTDSSKIGMDESKGENFIQGLKGVYLSDVYKLHDSSGTKDCFQIAVSAPLTDKKNATLLGVIVNFYDTSTLNKILSGEFQLEQGAFPGTLGRGETRDIYLVNRERLLITPSRFSSEVMKQKVETFPILEGAAGREIKGSYKNYLGSDVIGAALYIPMKEWVLLVEVNTGEAFLPVVTLRNRTIGLGIPIVVLAVFLAYLLSKESRGVIRESEERFRVFMDNSPAVIFMKDEKGRHVYTNALFLHYFKMKPDDILGKTDFEIWPSEIARQLRNNDDAVLSAKDVTELVETVPTPDGILRSWLTFKFTVKDSSGRVYLGGIAVDITEQRMVEELLRKNTQSLQAIINASPQAIVSLDTDGNVRSWNKAAEEIFGWSAEEVSGCFVPFVLNDVQAGFQAKLESIRAGEVVSDYETRLQKKDGSLIDARCSGSPVRGIQGDICGIMGMITDITGLKQITDELKESNERYRLLIESSQDGILAYDKDFCYTLWNKAMEEMSGMPREKVVGKTAFEVFPFLERVGMGDSFRNAVKGKTSVRTAVPYNVPQTEKHGYLDNVHFPLFNARGNIIGGMAVVREATKRIQTERRVNAQHAVTRVLAESATIEEASPKILKAVCEALGWDLGVIWLVERETNALHCAEIWHIPLLEIVEFRAVTRQMRFLPGIGLPGRVWARTEPEWIADVTKDANFTRASVAAKEGLCSAFAFPMVSGNGIFGVIEFFSHKIQSPDKDLLNMMGSIGSQIGQFIMRKRAEEQTRLQLQRVSALHDIDMAVTGSFDLRDTLDVFLSKVVTLLKVDAADVLLLNTRDQALEYAAGYGFRTEAILQSRVKLGEGAVGCAVLEQRLIGIPDLDKMGDAFVRAGFPGGEGFAAYYALPLVTKGKIKGVLELFCRAPFVAGKEWLEFLNVLATQGAVVIDNALLFEELQRSHAEIVVAYDRTIEGWSRALDIRDKETEGHAQRVTEMALRLARGMGMNDEELVHVRRGALLHDIGKLGIPDGILLKSTPLTDEEWAIMYNHPTYAHAMLAPVSYLRVAIDIPYCHHEKWDGTGYPRGLRGEQIPLSARIFAVVDVWDALRFDRPYRKGWPEEKIREHIRSSAGTHFDPKVVEVFLEIAW